MEFKQVLPLQVRVDLGVMAMNGYSQLPRSLDRDSPSDAVWYHTQDSPFWGEGVLPLCKEYSLDGYWE